MATDSNWPEQCNLISCSDPYLRPHHHHYSNFRNFQVTSEICQCGDIQLAGTRPKDTNDNKLT